jgi:hypothetical protein
VSKGRDWLEAEIRGFATREFRRARRQRSSMADRGFEWMRLKGIREAAEEGIQITGAGGYPAPAQLNYFFLAAFFLAAFFFAFFFAAIIVSYEVNLGIVSVRRFSALPSHDFFLERLAALLRRSSRKIPGKSCLVRQFYATVKKKCNSFVKYFDCGRRSVERLQHQSPVFDAVMQTSRKRLRSRSIAFRAAIVRARTVRQCSPVRG